MSEMNIDLRIRLNEDSSAAKGIAQRTGLGKVRHIEVNQLWVQEKVRDGTLEICKVKGVDNLADALTKYVDRNEISKHLDGTNCSIVGGRHDIMPEIAEYIEIEIEDDSIEHENVENVDLGSMNVFIVQRRQS